MLLSGRGNTFCGEISCIDGISPRVHRAWEEQAVAVSYRLYQITLEPNYGIEEVWNLLLEKENTEPEDEGEKRSEERRQQTGGCYAKQEKSTDCMEEELVYGAEKERGPQEMEGGRGEILLDKWREKGRKLIQTGKQLFSERMTGNRELL